jgi:hypothetical protein
MDNHDPVHYGLHGLAAIALAGVMFGLSGKPSVDQVSAVYHADPVALSAIPFEKTGYRVLAGPGSGAFPYLLADAIREKGGSAVEEAALDGHEGIWLSPDTPASHAIADALSKIIGDPVGVINDRDRSEIVVGFPFHKAVR